MKLLWLLVAIAVLAVGFRAFTDLFRRVVEAVIYTAVGLLAVVLIVKYRSDIFVWVLDMVNRILAS